MTHISHTIVGCHGNNDKFVCLYLVPLLLLIFFLVALFDNLLIFYSNQFKIMESLRTQMQLSAREAATIERRRRFEEERKKRIFDPKSRLIGVHSCIFIVEVNLLSVVVFSHRLTLMRWNGRWQIAGLMRCSSVKETCSTLFTALKMRSMLLNWRIGCLRFNSNTTFFCSQSRFE